MTNNAEREAKKYCKANGFDLTPCPTNPSLTFKKRETVQVFCAFVEAYELGRAQASGVPDEVRLALQYSRNYAKAAPYLNKTCIEHIEGLCDLLERISSEIPKKIIIGEDISPNREAYADGWNACRDAMLSAAPTPPKSASAPSLAEKGE